MNIVLINHYAGSPDMGMEFRPYYFAREWVKQGHTVHIIAADYSHLRRKNPTVSKDFEKEVIDGITYWWVKTINYGKNGGKRAITMGQFVGKLCLHAKKIVKTMQPDVVITSSTYPIDTFAGQRIRKKSKKKVKLIHEVHDMWPITPIEIGGMSPKHPFIRVMQCGEDSFCRKSDLVVSLLPYAKDYLHQHGMDKKKFRHVSNGIVLGEWDHPSQLPDEHLKRFEKLHEEDKKIICFFGSHTKSYSLDYFIDAMKALERDDIHAVFVGDGFYKTELIQRTKGTEERFTFLPPIPKQSIPTLFEHIDATYVGAVNNKMFRFGICMNKLFDSMMGGKPILYAVNAPNNYIEEYNCGISVEVENSQALEAGLNKLFDMPQKEREALGENGRKAVLEYFNYKVLSENFVRILKEESE